MVAIVGFSMIFGASLASILFVLVTPANVVPTPIVVERTTLAESWTRDDD